MSTAVDSSRDTAGVAASTNGGYTEWTAPEPLTRAVAPTDFPVDVLPEILRRMVTAAATSLQVPVELTGALAISAVDIAMGGRHSVHLWGDWIEPCQLYVIPVCQPGTRKSAIFDVMIATPIGAAERSLISELSSLAASSRAKLAACQKALEKAERDYARTPSDILMADVESAGTRVDAAEREAMASPRLFTSDVTVQQLEVMMSRHHGRMAIMAAESPLLANISGLYSGGIPQFDVLLAGHSSDSGQRTDRVSRDAVANDRPSLSMCLMVQPAVLTALTGKPEFVGRGLIQRMLPVMADVRVGERETGPSVPAIPAGVRAAYQLMVQTLAHDTHLSAHTVLELSDGAADVFAKLSAGVEADMKPGSGRRFAAYPLITEWASKYVGTVARIAAVLHIAEFGSGGGQVSEATASAAVAVGEFFAGHAIAAFSQTQAGSTTAGCRYLLQRLRDKGLETFSASEALRLSNRKGIGTSKEIEPFLDELVELGWLRELPKPPRPAGSRVRMPPKRWEAWPGLFRDTVRIG